MIAYGQQVTRKEILIFISVFAATALFASLKILPLAWSIMIPMLIWAAYTDISERIIPNTVLVVLLLVGVFQSPSNAVIGLFGCFVMLVPLYIMGGIGGGDVKLIASLGAVLGFSGGVCVLLYSSALALVFIAVRKLLNREIGDFIRDSIFSIRTFNSVKMEVPTDKQEMFKKTVPFAAYVLPAVLVYLFKGGLY